MWSIFAPICGDLGRKTSNSGSETTLAVEVRTAVLAYNKRKESHEVAERISVAATLRLTTSNKNKKIIKSDMDFLVSGRCVCVCVCVCVCD